MEGKKDEKLVEEGESKTIRNWKSRVRVNRARRKSSLIPDLIYIFIYWFQSITLVIIVITMADENEDLRSIATGSL
ncbi:hypothetical protein P8452_66205 [Trifolium repens]|nr:hypothetical protein P8452_66205 [Trifolium repens]